MLTKTNGKFDVFINGEHSTSIFIPSHGISKDLKPEIEDMLKAGGRVPRIANLLKERGVVLPDNFKQKIVNLRKHIREEDKKLIGDIQDTRGLTTWFHANHVNKLLQFYT